MTQPLPKASLSSRPPPPLGGSDGGRRITAVAAGGSVLLLSVTAVALWPRTYGTEATFVIDGGAPVANPIALAGRIEATLLEREELAKVAMDLPPELRSPDPIGRLRAGIRVQSRGVVGYGVEFRGSDPQSVQRIANHLADRAVVLVPKLAASPEDNTAALALVARTRAVTDFLTAHPEMTLEQAGGARPAAADDSGLQLLRTEKRQIEIRLSTGATDNPYADPEHDPEILNRRLTELKTTIARREAALKQPKPASPPAVAPELTAQWRTLLADLATAQADASTPVKHAAVTGHVTVRAPLPGSPLTPNRLVLSIVAALLSVAAAMIAYVLPRKAEPNRRQGPRATQRSEPPKQLGSEPPPAPAAGPARSEPPLPRSDPPPPKLLGSGSEPPPAGRPGSEPPGPIAVQRTVVLSGPAGGSGSNRPPPEAAAPKRFPTTPGGMAAPAEQATALASTALAAPPAPAAPPVAPLFGSRPPPGAGSYSVSSSHPPPVDNTHVVTRTSVEKLSPLLSAHPPSQAPVARRASPPDAPAPASEPGLIPQIMSKPPALDPDAESWAARFETPPPPPPDPTDVVTEEPALDQRRKRSGRWKTQVMGSMVSLEVAAAREERPPYSEGADSYRSERAPAPQQQQLAAPAATTVIHHDVPHGWRPNVDPTTPAILALRDAVLKQVSVRRLNIAVTGARGSSRAHVAGALALALAHSGARVLLVEGDFDNPEVHLALALSAPAGAGFSQQLVARRHDSKPRPWVVVRCSPTLQVLAEGRMRSPGSLAAEEFERAMADLREQHHVVLIHAPPLDNPADLKPIGGVAQAVVVTAADHSANIQFGDNVLRALL